MLKLSGVSKIYVAGEVQTRALDRIDLEIGAGEYVAIAGPSGCGKSTLLGVLGLLDVPSSGQFHFDGHDVSGWSEARLNGLRRGMVGFIFQSFNLIEELSVFENVELALEYTGVAAAERRRRVQAMLERLGVAHRSKHRPSQLSGGQQQRVAIARALAGSPKLLLADEPTGNLDTQMARGVMELLEEINAAGTTILMVTHDPELAVRSQRNVHIIDGQVSDLVRRAPSLVGDHDHAQATA